jgi:hypothetical protein
MDLALAFGTALEDVGIDAQYWEYGSEDEPQVHVGVEAQDIFFDNTFTWNKEDAGALGDFYADTELSWKPIQKKDIVGYIPHKRYADPSFDPEQAIRSTNLYKLFIYQLQEGSPMTRQQEMSTKADHAVFDTLKFLLQNPNLSPREAIKKTAMILNMKYETLAFSVLQFCERVVDDL